MALSQQSMARYSRQMLVEQVGIDGQQALLDARVLIVGAGGLGCPVMQYLVAAGVGYLRVMDPDVVELSNLQRQVLYKINHLGQPKVEVAQKMLYGLNPECELDVRKTTFDQQTADQALMDVDLVLDCSDNFATRYLLNRCCQQRGLPLIAAAAQGTQGQLWQIFPGDSPQSGCLNCLFPQSEALPVENCQTRGVVGAVLGIVGSMQASRAIAHLLGETPQNRFLQIDGFSMRINQFEIEADETCPVCGLAPAVADLNT